MKHPIIEEIKQEFYRLGLLQKKANFSCYIDNMFTYEIKDKDDTCFHEISFIKEHATLMNKEKVVDLLEQENIFYLRHCCFGPSGSFDEPGLKRLCYKEYRYVDTDDYEKTSKSQEQN